MGSNKRVRKAKAEIVADQKTRADAHAKRVAELLSRPTDGGVGALWAKSHELRKKQDEERAAAKGQRQVVVVVEAGEPETVTVPVQYIRFEEPDTVPSVPRGVPNWSEPDAPADQAGVKLKPTDLWRRCEACRGVKESDGAEPCGECEGHGIKLTPTGRAVLQFFRECKNAGLL